MFRQFQPVSANTDSLCLAPAALCYFDMLESVRATRIDKVDFVRDVLRKPISHVPELCFFCSWLKHGDKILVVTAQGGSGISVNNVKDVHHSAGVRG